MSNFYSRIPAIGATLGTVFALTVATPLLVSLIAKFTLGGNKAAVPYADTYIRNSDTIVVQIPDITLLHQLIKSSLRVHGLQEWHIHKNQLMSKYVFTPLNIKDI